VAKSSYNKTPAGEAEAHYAVLRQADSVIHGIQLLNMHPDTPVVRPKTRSRVNCIRCSSPLVSLA